MPKWNDDAVRHVRTSNNARSIERAPRSAASALWDVDAFEENFWDYAGAGAGWQVSAVDLGDPALSMGMVDEDGRFSWSVKDHTGKEVASGAARDLNAALDDAEMAYRISSDEEMDFMAKRTAMQEVRSLDRLAANISEGDLVSQGEGWYSYEPSDGPELTLTEYDPDEWTIEVAWPDGRSEESVINVWNDPDAKSEAVSFYNRVASVPTDFEYAPDSQKPVDTGDGNLGTVTVVDASEDNDPDFERNARRTAATDFSDVAFEYYFEWCRKTGTDVSHSTIQKWVETLPRSEALQVEPTNLMEQLEDMGIDFGMSVHPSEFTAGRTAARSKKASMGPARDAIENLIEFLGMDDNPHAHLAEDAEGFMHAGDWSNAIASVEDLIDSDTLTRDAAKFADQFIDEAMDAQEAGQVFASIRTAAGIDVKDVKQLDEGWFQYETPDGAELTITEDPGNPGSWTIEVVHPDGTYEEKTMESENIMDPIEMGVSFYNEVAPSGGGGSNQPVGIPSNDEDSDSYGSGGRTRNPDNIKRDENGKFARRKTASSMWDDISAGSHKVAGWNWDNHLEGFIAEGASAHFACVCGSNVEAPGYTTCACGKIWNSYPITSEGATKVFCREVPNRGEAVLLANRRPRTL